MDVQKLNFITKECVPLFKSLPGDTMGKWGKMNAQQTIEHLAAFFNVSAGKIKFDLVTPAEHLPKYKEFLVSDKEFRENTKAPTSVIGEDALPLQHANMDEALAKLEEGIAAFENYFKDNANGQSLHPVFGELDFEEWVLLHHKHVTHHVKQFGLQ